jgi:hypothetical protein
MDGKYNAFEMDTVHDNSSTFLSVLEALDTMVYSYSAKNISFVRLGRSLHNLEFTATAGIKTTENVIPLDTHYQQPPVRRIYESRKL